MTDEKVVRRAVRRIAERRGDTLCAASRAIGRNAAYLQQFVERGSPRRLPEDARLQLAQRWQIDERQLGARDPWTPERP